VLVDIQRLSEEARFDASAVGSVGLVLAEAREAVRVYLDDVMLVENSRPIRPVPEGMRLSKVGLEYRLEAPGRRPMVLRPSAEGLWRLGADQPLVQLAAPGKELPGEWEDLAILGPRRLGEAEILENNAVRVRLGSTWYFPPRGGEWAWTAVRRIRWEHTFYGDGRWVVFVEVNNAGGEEIASARFLLPQPAAWAGQLQPAKDRRVKDFGGSLGRWTFFLAREGADRDAMIAAYVDPPRLQVAIGASGPPAEGDSGGDGFVEAQGCYCLRAKAGHCRFTIPLRNPPVVNPVFQIQGSWRGPVHISSDGQAIRTVARLAEGSILFEVPGRVERETAVEVVGEVGPLGD
jgi:hypothetical protein